MTWRTWLLPTLLLPVLVLPAVLAGDTKKPKFTITWKKIVLDRTFRSEGVGVADVNKDGKLDVVIGDCWYEAPKDPAGQWKRHILRADRQFDLLQYSDSFCCFLDDFNGDGYPDVIVIPFPGNPCYWYENPGPKGGMWKAHLLTNSACNETPIYIDLFKTGKKYLVMAWNPPRDEKDLKKGNYDDRGEMCYFVPGKDPTQPWQRVSISGPSEKGNPIPATARFSHGLGHGDVNGDGRIDILCPQGWWEQPERPDGKPWKFHPARITDACADMYTLDIDGDGKADIISSSAHNYGFWWSRQQTANSFIQRPLFPTPFEAATLPKAHNLSTEELAWLTTINKARVELGLAPWKMNPILNAEARQHAEVTGAKVFDVSGAKAYAALGGRIVHVADGNGAFDPSASAKDFLKSLEKKHLAPNLEVGVGVKRLAKDKARYVLLLGDRKLFSLPSQTHALHCVDIDGDGLKDLVTGRRWWAHGPRGDAGPNDPAYLYWFQAKRGKDGLVTFTPHLIDDDSGVGTSFVVADINGDGLPDIVVSNKKGTHVFQQIRTPVK